MEQIDGRFYRVRRADLVRLRKAMMGPDRIAKLYGCDQSTVRHWLKRFGLDTRLTLKEAPVTQVNAFIKEFAR